jgi:hypothetical protein
MKPNLVKIDIGVWINPASVMIVGANGKENRVEIAFVNGANITLERIKGTPADNADAIAAIINGTGN